MNQREATNMARDLVRGSIIEDAAARFVAQVLKEAYDSRIEPLRSRIEQLQAELQEARMQSISHLGQAQDAYEAQKKAEAENKRLREFGDRLAYYVEQRIHAPDGREHFFSEQMQIALNDYRAALQENDG